MHIFWIASAANWLHGVDWRLAWIAVAAFLAGMLNALAGGGSLLSFPAMLGIGLGPIEANATNTVALWPGQLASIAGYWKDVRRHRGLVVWMGLAGLAGGSLGATMLLHTSASTFMKLVPWLMLAAALIFAFSGPLTRRSQQKTARHRSAVMHPSRYWLLVLPTAMICFYIGYFGAGAGFLLIALMTLFGIEDIHQMNALKVVATTMANGVACLLFILGGKVVWQYCLAGMITCAMGGYVASRSAKRINPQLLRGAVVVLGFTFAAYFFWKGY